MGLSEKYPNSSHKKCVQITLMRFESMETARFNRILRRNHDVTYISIPKEILEQMQLAPGEVVFVKISKGRAADDF